MNNEGLTLTLDLAGKGVADPRSMMEAIKMAVRMAKAD